MNCEFPPIAFDRKCPTSTIDRSNKERSAGVPQIRKIDAQWVGEIAALLDARDMPTHLILREVGLDPEQFSKDGAQVPFAKYVALIEAAARHSQNPCFGLHLGARLNLLEAGLLGYVTASAATLGDALDNLSKYQGYFTDGGRLRLEDDGPTKVLLFEMIDPDANPTRHYHECAVTAAMHICRFITGRHLQAFSVEFLHGEHPHGAAMQKYFAGPVMFGCNRLALTLRREDLAKPCVRADEGLLKILIAYSDELLAKRGLKSGLKNDLKLEVEELVVHFLPTGHLTADMIALELAMSTRTLARRLEAAGLTFRKIVENVRRTLAIRYLQEPSIQIGQIAYLLGYSETSAFTNVFRRWEGASPSQYRAAL